MWYNGAGGDFLTHLLVVDDEVSILELIKNSLGKDGHLITACQNADDVDIKKLHFYDLILLDVMMPGTDGFEFCKQIRNMVDCPILFLTAKTLEEDILFGLGIGADDYITKPFSLRELEARIVTNIKREERHQQKTEYRFMDEMLIDYSEKIVAIAGHRMEFTKIEYQIIEFLSMHPGQVFDKERIYAQVCGYDAEGDSRTITELVRRIRKKIADYSEKEYIETVWGIGYRWKK